MSYTTEQLLEILDQELRAMWKGERLLLSSADRLNNPVVAKALGQEKLSKVFAIQDFRAQIHAYQQEHNVSGLLWHTCHFRGLSVRQPELHPQLAAIPHDKAQLMAAKPAVVDFWHQARGDLSLWIAGTPPTPIALERVEALIDKSEWAEVAATRTELYLTLCWGDPQECHCEWAKPVSGCDRVIAAASHPTSVKI
ncbi:hypothetical protein C7271_01350 [filamentous cyanobacterium CCP5]|nr:hypothetical protein C7271_01350 [filamentous cyanobacterium CCP5]